MTDVEELLRTSLKAAPPVGPLAPWREIESRARRTRRTRWKRRCIVLGATTVALTGALLLAGSFDRSGPSPLARAGAAVVNWPPNQILHARILTTYNFPQPDSLEESWQQTSPPYATRYLSAFPADATGRQRSEFSADANGTGQAFDWRSDQVIQTTNLPAEWRPTGVAQTTHDQMQALISNGHWKSLGTSEIDGHQVLGFEAFGDSRIYLDAQTYLPVMEQSFDIGVGDQRRGYDRHYTFDLLPATPANRNLLDVSQQHPDAPTVPLTGPAWSAIEGQLGALINPPITPGA